MPKSPSVEPQAFIAFAAELGLHVSSIKANGHWQRVPVEGESGNKDGSYCLTKINGADQYQGLAWNWKRSATEQKGIYRTPGSPALTLQDKQRAAKDQSALVKEATKRAYVEMQQEWDAAKPANAKHPYLVAKAIPPGLLAQQADQLIVPMYSKEGELCGLQYIAADGEKKFKWNSAAKDASLLLGPEPKTVLYIVEGYATGWSVHAAAKSPVLIAFNAGNLPAVAKQARAKWPKVEIVIAADHDESGTGQKEAEVAARLSAGRVALPDFPQGEWGDFNDLRDPERIRACLAPTKDLPVPRIASLADSATHQQLARAILDTFPANSKPVFAEGSLWSCGKDNIWRPLPDTHLRNNVARLCEQGQWKAARTQRGYADLALRICEIVTDEAFFATAPVGVACPSGFHTLDRGRLACVERSPEQRTRFQLAWDPAAINEKTPDLWPWFLNQCFADADEAKQIAALQEVFGGSLFGLHAKFHKLVLLLGATRAGKGATARLLRKMFPVEAVCSVSPDQWDSDYHRATMAGKALNVVGELNERKMIVSVLKAISGEDPIGARWPMGRPFWYTNTAAHIFMSNHVVDVPDQDVGFWTRWVTLNYPNSRAGREDSTLEDRLHATCMPAIIGWSLDGALRLARRGRFAPGPQHDAVMERWKIAADVVKQFLFDEEWVTITKKKKDFVIGASLYLHFSRYVEAVGRGKLGQYKFYDRVEACGITRRREQTNSGPHGFSGLQLFNKSKIQ